MTYLHTRSEDKHHRSDIPTVAIKGDDGRQLRAFRLTCASCGSQADRLRSNAFADDSFRKIGWAVGNNASHDFCPRCVANNKTGKVVQMSDRAKQNEAPAVVVKTMQPVDRRLLLPEIAERWDEANNGYQMGWSDAKLAEAVGVPVAWVKEVREINFGGDGEDPTVATFIANQIDIQRDMKELADGFAEVLSTLKDTGRTQDILVERVNGLQKTLKRTTERVDGLDKIAERFGLKKAG